MEAIKDVPQLVDELRARVSHYAAIRKDVAGARFRALVANAALGILALMVASSAVVVSVWLVFTGLGLGLAMLFGDRLWLGYLVTGVTMLAVLAGGTWLTLRYWRQSSRERTIAKYEAMQQGHPNQAETTTGAGSQTAHPGASVRSSISMPTANPS